MELEMPVIIIFYLFFVLLFYFFIFPITVYPLYALFHLTHPHYWEEMSRHGPPPIILRRLPPPPNAFSLRGGHPCALRESHANNARPSGMERVLWVPIPCSHSVYSLPFPTIGGREGQLRP